MWVRMNLTKDICRLCNAPKFLNQASAAYELSVYHICMYTSETSQLKGTGFDSQSWVLVAHSFTHTAIQSSSVTTVSDMCEPKISSHVVGELFLWGKWGEDTHHAQDISDLTRATVDGRRYPRHSCRWYPPGPYEEDVSSPRSWYTRRHNVWNVNTVLGHKMAITFEQTDFLNWTYLNVAQIWTYSASCTSPGQPGWTTVCN